MNVDIIIMLVASAFAAFVMVNWIYFKILKIAKDKDLVDNPDARKLQKNPIPVVGGIVVFIGVAAGVFMASVFVDNLPGLKSTAYLLPVMMAMMVMLYIGVIDDIVGLSPVSRLIIEILTVLGLIYGGGFCIDSLHGVFAIDNFSWWIAVPLTVFAGVGIINAINMVDGVNGLSSGLCMIVALLFCVAFMRIRDYSNAMLALVMVVSLLPFYVHNVFGNRSRMFIGDAGTMVMGILLVWFTMSVLRSDSPLAYYSGAVGVNLIAMTLAFMSVPVFDTLRVMTMRILHGKSPFSPDKTHLHHVFIAAGISHFITSTSVILINVVITGIWALCIILRLSITIQLLVVIVCGAIFVWGTYGFIRYNELKHTEFMHWLSHFSVATHLGRTEKWKSISAWLDSPEEDSIVKEEQEHISHLSRRFDHVSDYKQLARKQLLDYIKGKAEVHVKDIIEHSGADNLRVYPLLFELKEEGILSVIRSDEWGSPEIVALNV